MVSPSKERFTFVISEISVVTSPKISSDGLMIEHLRRLLQLGKLSNQQLDILRNLSLLPVAGILKNSFKNWMRLDNLADVNHLIKYGFINEDTDNKKISLLFLILNLPK